ncbi:8754_t:CDS:2 [Funneliformis mosseae]|uniref:8754_t:CDS:1 n=1 Tax=Funneliformis mosseae TaxID=27381 RepID=A0A9N9DH74_FUNMO|nr:8754_t:CDS:2 [Funneliformis mosseae]
MTLLTSSIIVSTNELFKFILLILTLYTARFYFRYFTRKNKVPGPLPFPFFGTMPYSYIVGQYRFLNYCYEKYGTLFEIYVGDDLNTNREIYICKPELLEKIFSSSTKSNFLLRSPNNEGMNEFGFGKSGMVVNSDLSSWRRNRMLSVPLLMNAGFLKTQVHVIQELFQEMENYWKLLNDKNDEKIILDFTSWMHRFALDVVITSSLGRSSYALKSFYNTFTQSDGTIEKNENTSSIEYDSSDLLIRQVKSFFKALRFVKHPSWLRHTFLIYYNNFYLNEIKSLNNSIENFIKLRREEILLEIKNGKNVQEDRRDIMSLFLLKYSTIKNQDYVDRKMTKRHTEENFEVVTDEVIRSNLIEIFIGGNETRPIPSAKKSMYT